MDDTTIEKAEKRAYQKGYVAGRKRAKADKQAEIDWNNKERFRRQALLAAIPYVMQQNTWKRGDSEINTIADRMWLASRIADEAAKYY